MEDLKLEHPTLGETIEFYRLADIKNEFSEDIPKDMYDVSISELKALGQIDTLVFSFKREDTIVAIMEGHMYLDRDFPIIYLRHLIVHPDHRRNGYGTKAFMLFIDYFITHIRGTVPKEMWHLHMPRCVELIVETDDPIEFWKNLGFYEVSTIEGDKEHERRFRLDLEYNYEGENS